MKQAVRNINGYLLAAPNEYRKIPPIMVRLEKVAEMRRKSPATSVKRDAETPMLFTQIRQPETDYLVVPIEQTAQAILDARGLFPQASLADLYDEAAMPPELRKAHHDNDKAVMAAYGFKASMTESEVVAELFKLYENLTKAQ